MDLHYDRTSTESSYLTAAAVAEHSLFHEVWACGQCGRLFEDCTSCVAHEQQCGELTRQ
jgi:rubrerythrin